MSKRFNEARLCVDHASALNGRKRSMRVRAESLASDWATERLDGDLAFATCNPSSVRSVRLYRAGRGMYRDFYGHHYPGDVFA